MKRSLPLWTGAALLPLLLSACGSSNDAAVDTSPTISVTDLAAGAYAVSSGDASSPTAGKYYAAADGSRLLVLNNSSDQASNVYRREGSGKWQVTPAVTADTTLTLLNSSAITASTPTVAALARSYTVRLASGAAAAFTISSSGDIVAGSTSCKLTGKLSTGTLPNTLKLSLAAASCGDLPAQSDGVLVVDSDFAPAVFRLVTYSGAALVDLWAYAE